MVSPTNQSDVSDTYCTSSHSTSLKVFGEGEWKVKQHGKERRRIRRKLHLTVDVNTHQIIRPPRRPVAEQCDGLRSFPGSYQADPQKNQISRKDWPGSRGSGHGARVEQNDEDGYARKRAYCLRT